MSRVWVSKIDGQFKVIYDGVRLLDEQLGELKRAAVQCHCKRCTACVVHFLTTEQVAA